ncbi:MAG: cell division protein FtsZ, partial [Rhodobacteraceae bacterium]|nr:cell division protein FtsZ [Paracoccaceae bacterium]MCB1409948.1 cell division protein FtsZ [Paracoccaceae bacterium]
PQPVHAPAPEAIYTAPRPNRSAGQPSPETLERLRQAVMKEPEAPVVRRPQPAPQPMQHHQPAPQPQPQQQAAERGRFGLGSLINRMSGGHAAEAQPRHARPQPSVQSYDDEPQHRASHEQIEIPAFLRRQAN